jgi:hypothetical protein
MNRLAVAATTVALAALAPAASANGNGGRDFAVGAGDNEFALGAVGQAGFTVSAHSDPGGTRPSGYVTSRGDPDGIGPLEPFTAQGKVTCLRVDGNRASVKWRIERATGSAKPFEGGGIQSFLEDNGPPRGGRPRDRAAIDPPQPAASFNPGADACDDPNSRVTYETLNRGNVTVHDALGR